MQSALRPYTTAGIAIVGAGLIAVTPVTAPVQTTPHPEVALAAGEALPDFLAPWIEQYNTAAENASQIANNFFLAPGVGSQQLLANLSGYLQQFLNDPTASTLTDVTDAMRNDLNVISSSYSLFDVDQDTFDTTVLHTLDGGFIGHNTIFDSLPGLLPPGIDAGLLRPLLNFTASPRSGIMMGALGPAISPWVALGNSISDGDDFNETLANMVGAYYNGATLNLDGLLPLINGSGLLPAPTGLGHLDIAFGGLFTPGDVGAGPWHLYDADGNTIAEIEAVGGSMLNSIGMELTGVPGVGPVNIASHAVGPLAAWEGWSQLIGIELGDGWDGKNAPAIPPGTGIDFPTFPDDVFNDSVDAGASGAAAVAADSAGDWSGLIQDLLADLGF